MPSQYTIYLVNQAADIQLFWLFLAPPKELEGDPTVFANSNATLAVMSNAPFSNRFDIPVQYVVGAGAGQHAVGSGVWIASSVTRVAGVRTIWDVYYATAPPNQGPHMQQRAGEAPANSIGIASNAFNKLSNEINGLFASQSFGITTSAGFIGLTWSPNPRQTRVITPRLTFCVAVGGYGSHFLVSWTDVVSAAAVVEAPAGFDNNHNCTVTFTPTGRWLVQPGAPPALEAPQERSAADKSNGVNVNTLVAVSWDSGHSSNESGFTNLTGQLTVATALPAAFTYFVVAGIRFPTTRIAVGGVTVAFIYSGFQSPETIRGLFQPGVQLFFSR